LTAVVSADRRLALTDIGESSSNVFKFGTQIGREQQVELNAGVVANAFEAMQRGVSGVIRLRMLEASRKMYCGIAHAGG
jgi:hypothetical protein